MTSNPEKEGSILHDKVPSKCLMTRVEGIQGINKAPSIYRSRARGRLRSAGSNS